MEIYDPQFPGVGAYVHVLPATDTCTGLRPGILTSETRAALFHNGQSDPLLDRSGHTISELTGSNQALVAGGVNSSGSVLDSISTLSSTSASISTDKMDYAPGETATISGRGFQPGEIVRLKIHEDPHTPQERGFDATADADGNFSGEYLVQDYDLDMKFIVSARGLTSGWTAHTSFTDANNDAHVAPGWAPDQHGDDLQLALSQDYRRHRSARSDHAARRLHEHQCCLRWRSRPERGAPRWSTRSTRTIDIQLTAGTGLATNNVELGADRRHCDDATGESKRQRRRVGHADVYQHRRHGRRAKRQPARPDRQHHQPVGHHHLCRCGRDAYRLTRAAERRLGDRSRPDHAVREAGSSTPMSRSPPASAARPP